MSVIAAGGSYNGLAFGPGTRFPVQGIDGLFDLPEVRNRDAARPDDHGDLAGDDYTAGRRIVLTLGLWADDPADLDNLREQVRTAFAVGVDAPLVLPGGTRQVTGRTRRRALAVDAEYPARFGQAVLEVYAPDPRIYTVEESVQQATLPTSGAAAGVLFPLAYPLNFRGANAGGSLVLENTGNADVWPTLTLTGPITNPVVTNLATGETLTLTYELPAGDTLVMDTQERTILLNGTANRRTALAAGSRWPRVVPGSNEFQFRGVYTETVADGYANGYADTYGGSTPPLLEIRHRSGSL